MKGGKTRVRNRSDDASSHVAKGMKTVRANVRRARNGWRAMPRVRIMVWALLVSVLCGVTGFLEPVDDLLRGLRYQIRYEKADQSIVVVGIDKRSMDATGNRWPWTRDKYALMIERLKKSGAKRIVFDNAMAYGDTPENDRAFISVAERYRGDIFLGAGFGQRKGETFQNMTLPHSAIRSSAEIASFKTWLNPLNQPDQVMMDASDGTNRYPSLSTVLSRVNPIPNHRVRPDFAIRLDTFPYLSAIDILDSSRNVAGVAGRDILIGATARSLGDNRSLPGQGFYPAVYVHAIAAQTLKSGLPLELGWTMPLAVALGLGCVALIARKRVHILFAATSSALVLLAAPIWLENSQVYVEISPAILAATMIGIQVARLRLGWIKSRTNDNSGLGNMIALRELENTGAGALIAARVGNYAAIVTSFPREVESALVGHIVERLRVRDETVRMYQGDDGVFFWTTPLIDHVELGAHLEGLHSFFGQPVVIDGNRIDVSMTLGADTDASRSITSRAGSALLSAEEAATSSSRWRIYDPARGEDATWELSLIGEIDRGIEAEQFWLAFQPKLDLRTGEMTGAEVLLRWAHPERGSVSPLEFIPAAERSNRIGRLTAYVLRRAVAALWHLSREGDYKLAVNVSVPVLGQPNFAGSLLALCQRQQVDPTRLTLEITESTLIASDDARADATLAELRSYGFGLSIDDFGTGFSSLEYVRRIPAHEMKIDQTFVRRMLDSPADRVVVESVLRMAHELDRRVVAEGVETEEALTLLRELGCDEAQGYLIGRPVDFDTFMAPLIAKKRSAA